MSGVLDAATLVAALGCGLVAGVFFAFSTFVMGALARLSPAQGITAMQAINRAAISPLFMVALFGNAVLCLALVGWAAASWGEGAAPWLMAGGALYVVGAIVLTIVRNVPLNDALATLDPADAEAAGQWTRYVRDWTAWNHVRGGAALGAAALLTVSLAVA